MLKQFDPGLRTRQEQRVRAKMDNLMGFKGEPVSRKGAEKVLAAPRKPGEPKRIGPEQKWVQYDHPQPREAAYPFANAENYIARLKKRGFRRIGMGAYSTVLAKPGSDRVIKVCRRAEGDSYPMFAEWAHANPSPYLPRIHSFKRHAERKDPSQSYYVVVLDRLARTVANTDHFEGYREATEMLAQFTRRPEAIEKGLKRVMLKGVFEAMPGLEEVLTKFREEFEDLAYFDMHEGNWMLTKDDQLVLIDPLSCGSSYNSEERNRRVSRIKAVMRPAA